MSLEQLETSILKVVTKPENCLLLIAFALTEEDFINELAENSQKDYARSATKNIKLRPPVLWTKFHLPLVNVIKNTAATAARCGVTVKLHTTMKDLLDLSSYKVVTIMAHYNDQLQQIELSDRLHDMDEFIAAIDKDFTGIIDMSVCNSAILQDKLKEKYGDVVFVKAKRELAEIKINLIIYKNVIELLHLSQTKNYLAEMIKLMTELNVYTKKTPDRYA